MRQVTSRPHVTALVAVALAAASGCGAQRSGNEAGSGLYGKVVVSPATPVCTAGSSCSRPAAHLALAFWRNGHRAASARTDERGSYRIRLVPGSYALRVSRGALRPATATVPSGRYARVTLTYDAGIR